MRLKKRRQRTRQLGKLMGVAIVAMLAVVGAAALVLAATGDAELPWATSGESSESSVGAMATAGPEVAASSYVPASTAPTPASGVTQTTAGQVSASSSESSSSTTAVSPAPASTTASTLSAQELRCRDAVLAPIGDSAMDRATHAHAILVQCEGVLDAADLSAVRDQFDLAVLEHARATAAPATTLPAVQLFSGTALRQLIDDVFVALAGRGATNRETEDFVDLVHDEQREQHRRRYSGSESESVDPVAMAEVFVCDRDPVRCRNVKYSKAAEGLMEELRSRSGLGGE